MSAWGLFWLWLRPDIAASNSQEIIRRVRLNEAIPTPVSYATAAPLRHRAI